MKLIFLRHGETVENSKGIVQGHLPGKLNEEGILQAKKAANRLKDEKIDIIYSSDLYRTVETTAEIIKFFRDVPVIYTQELREINMGANQGKTMEELNWIKNFTGKYTPPEGGESSEELYERVEKFLNFLLEKHQNQTVLCVTHGGTIKAFVSKFTGIDKSYVFSVEHQKNTGISIINVNKNMNFEILVLNDISHLG